MPESKKKTLPQPSDKHPQIRESGFRALFFKLRKRRIIETLAAFIGGGWLIIEFVDRILVAHYHFPDKAIDITFVTLLGALFTTLIWRWFSGREKPRKFKPEAVLIPLVLLIIILLDVNLVLHLKPVESGTFSAPKWKNSIAVLPFEDMSPQKDQNWFCDGITDEIIGRLSNIGGLKVPARTSVFFFKGKGQDVREIGNKLGVAAVLEGSIQKIGTKLRARVQLINIADGFHLWSTEYDKELKDLFAVQDEIALAVAEKLKVTLLGEEKAKLTKSGTSNVASFQLYLQGKYHLYNETPQEMLRARDYFEEAIREDENFPVAHAGLADSYLNLGFYGILPRDDCEAKAKAEVRKALGLDSELSEGYYSRAVIKMVFDLDWRGAEADFKRAIALNANNFDAYRVYALLLMRNFRYKESERAFLQGQAIDPLNVLLMRDLRTVYQCTGQDQKAERLKEQMISVRPDWANFGDESYFDLERIKATVREQGRYPNNLADLAIAYAESGDSAESQRVVKEMEDLYARKHEGNTALSLAFFYEHTGDRGRALDWLETAVRDRAPEICDLPRCAHFRSIQKEPRYQAILKKIGVK